MEDKAKDQEMEEATEGNEQEGCQAPEETSGMQELPEEEILRLEEELTARTREAEENYSSYLRARADLDNFKKRAAQEKADFLAYSNEGLILEILPVIDNLERALEHAENGGEALESFRHGVKLTLDQLAAVLEKFGVKQIKAVGKKFDPAVHHAISHESDSDAEPDIVVKEFQKGYFLKDRLLRPAMVSVAK